MNMYKAFDVCKMIDPYGQKELNCHAVLKYSNKMEKKSSSFYAITNFAILNLHLFTFIPNIPS